MLPDIDLDNESFDDIMENAKNSIVSSYPEWTDFNYHDPGMTMLETMAWLKEIQQYYLNKIGPANLQKYMKLLGIRRHTKRPSSTEVSVQWSDDLVAAKGTRLYAGDICFEAAERSYVSSSRLICCICKSGDDMRVIDHSELSFGGNLRISPFLSGIGSEFYVGFDKPLAEKERHLLHIEINDRGSIRRNPITDPDSFIPLVDIAAEYSTAQGWKALQWSDGTFGFLSSGTISLTPDSAHVSVSVGGREAYFIRFRLTGGEYDICPQIRRPEFNLLPVLQRETLAECLDLAPEGEVKLLTELSVRGVTRVFSRGGKGFFTRIASFEKTIDETSGEVTLRLELPEDCAGLRIVSLDPDFLAMSEIGFGTGLPFQEFDLETDRLEYDSFRIMTELPASGGRLVEWTKVRDFSTARAEDFVYMLDTAAGVIRFGNCLRGMAPEGRIFIVGCTKTRGSGGNVAVGRINRMDSMDDEGLRITNKRRSEGGANEETVEQCCMRAYRMMQTTETLVTDEDHERFIKGIQGLKIETCHILNSDQSDERRNDPVRPIVVKPYTEDGQGVPGERCCKNILAALEKKRILGTGFRIVSPEYAGVRVYADITVERSAAGARDELERVIREYFGQYRDCFGVKLIYSKLYEMIDRQSFVISLNTLNMETRGSGATYTREGDLLLSPSVMAYLSETDLMISVR